MALKARFYFWALLSGILWLALVSPETAHGSEKWPSGPEGELLSRIRVERKLRGLPDLTYSKNLSRLARLHALKMANRRRIFHLDDEGRTAGKRLWDAGFRVSLYFENVGVSPSIVGVHEAFLRSPGHRAHLLNEAPREIGVGVAEAYLNNRTAYYVAELFVVFLPVPESDAPEFFLQSLNSLRKHLRLPLFKISPELQAYLNQQPSSHSTAERVEAISYPPNPRSPVTSLAYTQTLLDEYPAKVTRVLLDTKHRKIAIRIRVRMDESTLIAYYHLECLLQ